MNLLDLFVRITAKDEASGTIDDVSQGLVGKLSSAAGKAAKALAALWAGSKVIQFGKQAFDAYAQFEQLEGGIAKLYGNAGMSIEQYAQSVGKAVDEVSADYKRNEEAQRLVMENAQQAWRTAGMDANSYMQTATSFSASLINSLGGDTKEAARLTDEAMRAMSDNVNTFGSDMGSVQNAFQGFAKQNYTMLDNLKLGYGGTKTEMERLIQDASKMTAEQEALNMKVDAGSMSFDNIVKAIQVVQKHQGIYGTTAKEALNTIEGSMNATKAAWQNLVAEVGKPDADIGARIKDMMTAIMGENGEGGVLRNVTREVRTIVTNVTRAISNGLAEGFNWLVSEGPRMALKAVKGIVSTMKSLASSIGSFDLSSVFSNFDFGGMWERLSDAASDVVEIIRKCTPGLIEAARSVMTAVGIAIENNWPVIVDKVGEVLGNVGSAILEHGPELIGAASDALASLIEWVTSNGPELVDKAAEIVGNVVDTVRQWLIDNGPAILEAAGTMFGNIASAIVEHAPEILSNIGKTIGKVIGHIVDAAPKMAKAAVEFMSGLINGTSEEGEKLHQWFADLPQNLLNALGDLGTFLLDAGKSLINGLLDGIGEVAPDVEQAIRDAFDRVLDFFGGVASFIADPIGSIKSGLSILSDSFWGTEGDVSGAMSSAGGAINEFNDTKLEDKSAKATVKGNAIDGTGKSRVNDTKTAINNLNSKDVSVNVRGNVLGDAASKIWDVVGAVRNMASKTIDIVTNNITKNITKNEKHGGAWGGITPRYHAMGGVKVANRYGAGVPLDVVGERGPEAIVPLTSHYGADFARMVGEEAAKYMGGPTYILQIGDIEYNTDAAMDAAIDHWFRVAARRAGQYGIG